MKKSPYGPEQAEHAAVRELLHVDLGNLRRVGGDPPPVGMRLVDLALEARRIDAQDADAELLVLGDVLRQPIERDVRAAPLEQLAVVVGVERIDEAHLADRDAVLRGACAGRAIHDREGVAAADRVLHPRGDLDLAERLRVERLLQNRLRPNLMRLCDRKYRRGETRSRMGTKGMQRMTDSGAGHERD